MTTCFLAPDPIQSTQFIPGGNTPANGGQLFFYAAGSSTKQTVYKDNAAGVAWSNPIVLDSGGNLPSGGEVWFPTGQSFKVVFAPSNDTDPPASPYWSKDNLTGMNDTTASVSDWISGPTPTFVSATSFTLVGDQTLIFTKGRRIKTTNTGGTVLSTVVNSVFGATTTVTVVNDSPGVLDAGLSAVFYGLIDPSLSSISDYAIHRKGVAVASASTTNIWGTSGDYVHVTGTNTIFNFSTAPYAGSVRRLNFDGAAIISSSSALTVPGNINISTNAGDTFSVVAETVSTAVITGYLPASGVLSSLTKQSSGTIFGGPATGTTTQFPAFRSIVGGDAAMALLQVTTVASSATVDFVLNSSDPYNVYQVIGYNIVPTNNNTPLQMRFSEDSGATFISTNVYYSNNFFFNGVSNNSTNLFGNGGSSSSIFILSAVLNNAAAGRNARMEATIYNPFALAPFKIVKYEASAIVGAPEIDHSLGSGYYTSTNSQITGIRLLTTPTGFFSTGTFSLYGIRKS